MNIADAQLEKESLASIRDDLLPPKTTDGVAAKTARGLSKRRRLDAGDMSRRATSGSSRAYKKEFGKGSKALLELEKLPKGKTAEWRKLHSSLDNPKLARLAKIARLERVKIKRGIQPSGKMAAEKQKSLMNLQEREKLSR